MIMESKEEKGESVVALVEDFYFTNEEFAQFFEDWCKEKAPQIDLSTEECKLEYTNLYNEFLRHFEDKITEFIETNGHTLQEFYEELKNAEKDSEKDVFVQIMNATTDFDVFIDMMRTSAAQCGQRRKK